MRICKVFFLCIMTFYASMAVAASNRSGGGTNPLPLPHCLSDYILLASVSIIFVQAILLCLLYQRYRRLILLQHKELQQTKPHLSSATEDRDLMDKDNMEADENATREDAREGGTEEISASMKHLYSKVLAAMSERQLYTNPRLSLADLAKETCTNQSRISQCINKMSGQNLNTWLGQFRVRHAMKLMEENPDISEEELMAQSGFASHASYYRIFHKTTGCSPKQHLARQKEENG